LDFGVGGGIGGGIGGHKFYVRAIREFLFGLGSIVGLRMIARAMRLFMGFIMLNYF